MNLRLASISALLALTAIVRATDTATPPAAARRPCCTPEKPAAAPCCTEEKPSAPLTARSLYQLDARWTNDSGASVSLAALRGKPVVLAMFFAQCEYACPVLVHDMERLRAALPPTVREQTQFVLVSFDTRRDTPEALKSYRARMNLDSGWTLLRGDDAAVQELAMLLGVKFKQDNRGQFAHSNLITILNPEGEIAHQHAGLNGDISMAAKAVAAAKK